MKNITLLGSTGSIGTQALQVIGAYPERFRVRSLAANTSVEQLAHQARRFMPDMVAISDVSCYNELKSALADVDIQVLAGADEVSRLAADADTDMVLNSLVGFAGLGPTLAALSAGNTLALANKESLVAGGHLAMELAAAGGVDILPVDSEHSAIFQCLQGQKINAVERIVLTASGGPFFGKTQDELAHITAAHALKHPNWDMGAKITIDSATLMNKGLEVMEARWLFDTAYEQIHVVVHRESIIHSLVEFCDGAVLAQLGAPDMRVPIQYALTWPERLPGDAPRISWEQLGTMHFAPPDREVFPCLDLAYAAGREGGSMPCVLNAANEEAVALFLKGEIGFLTIPRIIETVMNKHKVITTPDFDTLAETDREARRLARESAGMKG
ncbi:1-deoxy-D-xylulose-5-phosphate reductoisomerase [Dethiobacter alkaliphilus]|uniref:1-deoxy-D-xylulose-5-phosphate reductoisomerase n=1 Tax=Dethiobacter alkaliphilus TaxID=427926 RepID=UPI002227A334|nr:1-deoxy-D-xylulose-5-phosphate reductoisomerase [Dethiobacter alkaliphilus]MCW3490851.1 1-deoxy-D-xylulose-5-phosphate reductoisomerase [Dethiobacter alkaliphilus]